MHKEEGKKVEMKERRKTVITEKRGGGESRCRGRRGEEQMHKEEGKEV